MLGIGIAFLMMDQTKIRLLDLDQDANRQVVVDKQEGHYLGHVSTVLLSDRKTILAVYPQGHGKGPILYKKSGNGGKTWSDRLPTPGSWATSLETPTIHCTIDPRSKKERLILWSGLYPARLASSEDNGKTWSELRSAGDWGGIVIMGFVERLKNGDYLAMFHDDGRFFRDHGKQTGKFTLYQTLSHDGGLHWEFPKSIWSGSDIELCEPGVVRSPDGRTLAVLLRENSRKHNSHVIFSNDEGKSWSRPRELPWTLTGDRHIARYSPDGRLVIVFRDMAANSETKGDWVAWVGNWDDLVNNKEGQYRVRLKNNVDSWDCGYSGLEVLPDGTFVATTYGHWEAGKEPYILSVRFKLSDLDKLGR